MASRRYRAYDRVVEFCRPMWPSLMSRVGEEILLVVCMRLFSGENQRLGALEKVDVWARGGVKCVKREGHWTIAINLGYK